MKSYTRLNHDDKAKMISDFMDGYNAVQLAKDYDVSYGTACKIIAPTRQKIAAGKLPVITKAKSTKPTETKQRVMQVSESADAFLTAMGMLMGQSPAAVLDGMIIQARTKMGLVDAQTKD